MSLFDFQVENSARTVQYKLDAQSLRLFGLHSDVNDAHRAGANRLQNKNKQPMYGQTCGSMSDASKNKVTKKWAIEKPKIDNARQLRGILH